MLYKDKPYVEKKILRLYRSKKWEHANEVVEYFTSKGIEVHVFEKSKATPHIRIGNKVDYWPASSRFYFLEQGTWGVGYEQLKSVFDVVANTDLELKFKKKLLDPKS